MADPTAAPPYEVIVGEGKDGTVAKTDVLSFVIERDMFQPDMATIVLHNEKAKYSKIEIGAAVEIKVNDDAVSIYKGEVVGIEPIYKGGEKTKILIRAMNQFHRLLRFRKSITFTDKNDSEILTQVIKDAELNLKWKHEKSIPYKHVYQHNQTAMEFVRTRAARMGCHVWCVGKDLFVQEPDLTQEPDVTLKLKDPGGGAKKETAIRAFTPRLSSSAILNKVTVKGWNPETKELIVGEYASKKSKLGKDTAVAGSKKLGKEETFTVDHPIWSKEEANALAKARLVELSLTYITGECEITGDPKFDLGKTVAIEVNNDKTGDTKPDDDPFNGWYYICGITHRYQINRTDKDVGFTTILRVARDAQKPEKKVEQ